MSCPTCDNEMKIIGSTSGGYGIAWCERCGSLRLGDHHSHVPELVDRCRNLQVSLIEAKQAEGVEALRILGITEAINKPEDRP